MTVWRRSVGDLLDLPADVLVCSANPQLNLSGGVGGEILRRFGPQMQTFLHDALRASGQRWIAPGDVMPAPSCGTPFRAVLHACAIDAFYETSAELIRQTLERALTLARELGCGTVASACLGCGYGRATPEVFAQALAGLWGGEVPQIDSIEFRSTNSDVIDTIRTLGP